MAIKQISILLIKYQTFEIYNLKIRLFGRYFQKLTVKPSTSCFELKSTDVHILRIKNGSNLLQYKVNKLRAKKICF